MKFKFITLLFLPLCFCLRSEASLSCDLLKLLQHPSIVSNESFWKKYTELAQNKKLNDRTLEKLLNEHNVEKTGVHPPLTPHRSPNVLVETSKKADKDLAKLPKELKVKFEEFMSAISSEEGINGLYKNPGRWHLEKLTSNDSYTVRLNSSVRVNFTIDQGKVHIIQVNADHVHNHLK